MSKDYGKSAKPIFSLFFLQVLMRFSKPLKFEASRFMQAIIDYIW